MTHPELQRLEQSWSVLGFCGHPVRVGQAEPGTEVALVLSIPLLPARTPGLPASQREDALASYHGAHCLPWTKLP